ncbi:MAG TPA: SemiSWEET family transporter [Nitrososphaeraceae archaeon]|nr:SemiSWEET family transporter [Nitrososphaeraceae archaeon]
MPTIIVTIIGIMATVFAVSSSIPQIIKALKTRKTDDVSIWLVVVLIIGLSLWVIYGVGINDLLVSIANSIAVAINTFLLILKIKYSRDPIS